MPWGHTRAIPVHTMARVIDLYDEARMPPSLLRGAQTAATRQDLVRSGLSARAIQRRLTSRSASRQFRDGYLLGDGPPDLLDRIRALMPLLPDGCAVGFHTGAALHGFGVAHSDLLHVVVPPGAAIPQRRGVVAHETTVDFGEPKRVLGVPCLPPARCAVDLARTLPRADALPVLDAALRCAACVEDDLLTEIAAHERLRGVRRARDLCLLASPLPECRHETQLRLMLLDAALPAPCIRLP